MDKESKSLCTFAETEEEKQHRLNSIYEKQFELFDIKKYEATEETPEFYTIEYKGQQVTGNIFMEEQEAIDYLVSKPYDIIITIMMGVSIFMNQELNKNKNELKENLEEIKKQ